MALVVATVLGIALAVVVFALVAGTTTVIPLASALGLITLLLVVGGVAWLVWRRHPRRSRLRRTAVTAVAVGTVVSIAAAATVFNPHDYPTPVATPAVGQQYWDLSNGDRIAYTTSAAQGERKATPVVFLHGGPGTPGEPGGPLLAGPNGLSRSGYDVYVYDQVGAGLSSRLDDAGDYTVERHVEDLELIRAEIGAERMILVGHSWGAALAGHYVVAHPDRVERLVLEAPGAMYVPRFPDAKKPSAEENRSDAAKQRESELQSSPRLGAAFTLASLFSLQAGRALVGDDEMDAALAQLLPTTPSYTCDPAEEPVLPPGMRPGFWVNLATGASESVVDDPRPALRRAQIPALVMTSECDYELPEVSSEWRATLPDSTRVVVPDAGHFIQQQQPDLFLRTVIAFLADDRLPLPDQP
ncbi:MAG: alpha/beta fold hydrolase [Phycicoccus sp.]